MQLRRILRVGFGRCSDTVYLGRRVVKRLWVQILSLVKLGVIGSCLILLLVKVKVVGLNRERRILGVRLLVKRHSKIHQSGFRKIIIFRGLG